MDRLKAAGAHLAASILFVGGLAALMVWFWYPPAHERLLGGFTLLQLILSIDIIAGPVLTLLVFDRRKPRLKLDLALIVLAQAAFLVYGLHTAASSRPVYLVAAGDTFRLVTVAEIDREALEAARGTGYEHLSWTGPRLVGAKLSAGIELGEPVHFHPRYFVPYEQVAAEMSANAGNPEALLRTLPTEAADRLRAVLSEYPEGALAVVWLIAPNAAGIALVDRASGALVRTLDIGLK
jgi:hypothetical protein